MKTNKFIIVIYILLLIFLIPMKLNINDLSNLNLKLSDSNTNFQNPNIVENIDNDFGIEFYDLFCVKTQNDYYGHADLLPQENTDWVRCTDFNFNLPDNSIIKGIIVQIDDYDGFFDNVLAQDIYLVLNGYRIGIDKESGNPIGTSDTDTYRAYGNSNDIWNTELTKLDIESSTFGVQIFYHSTDTFIMWNVFIDNIQIQIHYSISEPEPEPEPEINIDFIIIFSLLGFFSIMILILMFTILIIKKT